MVLVVRPVAARFKEEISVPELYHLPGFHEPFSALSHLLGAAVFLVLGALLLRRGRGDSERLIYLSIYVVSCVVLLAMSSLYHMTVTGSIAHRVFERLDHAAIFLLIAGTFTPGYGILFHGWQRWGPLLLIWSAALTGIALKSIFFDQLPTWVGLSLYLLLGWISAPWVILLWRRYGYDFIQPLLWGGLAYSFGALINFLGWRVFVPGVIHPHEVFHVAVLIGIYLHYLFIWQIADGEVPEMVGAY